MSADEIFLKRLGKRITKCRESLDSPLSKQKLAEAVGISRMQMHRIETGSSDGNPSILVLRKIAWHLEITLAELVDF